MLHVAIVTRSLMTGGAQHQIVMLSQAFDRERVRMTLFLLINDEPRDLVGEVPGDVEIVSSPFRRRDPRVIGWLARELRRRRIDVAHSFLWTGDVIAALSRALFGGPPLVISERGDRGFVGYSRMRQYFDRMVTFRVAVRAVANSRFGAGMLATYGCPPQKIRVIPNGVDVAAVDAEKVRDLRAELGWPADVTIVGSVARLVDYKGIDDLLRAMAILLRDDPQYRCVLVGEGPQRHELEALTATLGIREQVRFLGLQRPAIPLAKGFDVVTRGSTEHCSNSLLEAMTCGTPIIATNAGGNSELINNGESGWLVPPGDPLALANAIREVRANGGQARRMASNARKKIERDHALAATCSRFMDVWDDVRERRA